MIDFEITRIDEPAMTVQIKYSKEGFPDYYVRSYVGSPFNEAAIIAQAKSSNNTLQVTNYWNNIPENGIELSTTTGQIKETVVAEKPTYDSGTEKLQKVVTEEENQFSESWVVQALSEEELASAIRAKRDVLLQQTDSFALSDRSMSDEMTAYRTALRDITEQAEFPFNVVWPVKPLD